MTKFYKCNRCGNVAIKVVDSGVPMVCCGEKMELLEPNVVDASGEKHMPVVSLLGDGKIRVEVGSVHHPMTPEHHIAFIYVETDQGGIRVDLKDTPVADRLSTRPVLWTLACLGLAVAVLIFGSYGMGFDAGAFIYGTF